jgi:ParB family chromosome partitioning protein
MTVKKRGLGRGLDALLGQSAAGRAASSGRESALRSVAVSDLVPGPFQPRKAMDPSRLRELADSISAQGLVQPIAVRETASGFEIIAGERRWRAAQMAGHKTVPVVIHAVSDSAALAIALIENIQREDLNAMEQAEGLRRLLEEYQMTHQQLADAVGKSRVAVSNLLRLNELAEPVKALLQAGDIEMGHARALIGLPPETQAALAAQVTVRDLTVRQIEAEAQALRAGRVPRASPPASGRSKPPDLRQLEERLAARLGAAVQIHHGAKGGGRILIRYTSLDELDGVLERLAAAD